MLILGYSSVVRRRVLAAARVAFPDAPIEVASRRFTAGVPPELGGLTTWTDYGEALRRSERSLVYVSLVNSLHAPWVTRALASGRDVIVDKPAFLALADAAAAIEQATASGRVLAEATVWPFHPQVARLRERVTDPLRATVAFSFPPLPPNDFRWEVGLGGGALWDLGPYSASAGRVLFGGEPQEIAARIVTRRRDVDAAFVFFADYGGGRALAGHMGFGPAYVNSMEVAGSEASVAVSRIFTTPPTLENSLRVRDGGGARVEEEVAADTFAEFLAAVDAARRAGDWTALREALWTDARFVDRLRLRAMGGR